MNGRSAFPVLTLRQASFIKLRTVRANGLKNEPLTRLRTEQGKGIGKDACENPKRLKMA
jgi:hypothetical protein